MRQARFVRKADGSQRRRVPANGGSCARRRVFCSGSHRFFASRRARRGCGSKWRPEKIGRIIFARSEFSFPGGAGHPRAWINDPAVAGGGPIADIGVHCIDSLRYILQDEVVRVSARGFQDSVSGELEAAAALTLEFSRGTLGTVLVSFRGGYRTPIELVGETGVLRGEDVLNVERPITLELRRAGAVLEAETRFQPVSRMRNRWMRSRQRWKAPRSFRYQAKRVGRIRSFWMRRIAV